jgi:hypothetical protein
MDRREFISLLGNLEAQAANAELRGRVFPDDARFKCTQ